MSRGAALLLALLASLAAGSAAHSQAPSKSGQKATTKSAPAKQSPRPSPLERLQQDAYEALDRKDYQTAADLFAKYVTEKPDDAVAYFQLGYALTALGRKDDAAAAFRKAIALDPNMGPAYLNLGLLLRAKDRVAAEAPLVRAAELMPADAEAQYQAGSVLRDNAKYSDAEPLLRRAVALKDANADYHFSLGNFLQGRQRMAEAEKEFRRALELRPAFPLAHSALAQTLLAQNRLEEAAGELVIFLQAEPKNAVVRLELASIYGRLEKYDEAYVQLDAVSADPGFAAHGDDLRTDLLMKQKRYADAAATLRRIVARSPKDADAHARLGHALLEMRDFPAAQRELIAALAIQPQLTDALPDLLSAYFLAENYPAALATLDELDKRETPGAPAWFIRALCYDKLHRRPEALAAYETFLGLDGGRDADRNFQARQRVRILRAELKK